MRVFIVGGRGRIALLLTRLLAETGHEVVGTVRDLAQDREIRDAGGTAVRFDIADGSVDVLAKHLDGQDATVFAAGAGYGSTTAQKIQVDRDGAIMLADAAGLAGAHRLVVISSMGADSSAPGLSDPFQTYLRLKGDADAVIRARDLAWTIVRPSGLNNLPGTGRVTIGTDLRGGSVARADVAAVIARLLVENLAVRRQFDVTSGSEPISDLTFG